VKAHTAAGKLQGFKEDAPWYEAAYVVGVTNAMNVVADGLAGLSGASPLIAPLEPAACDKRAAALYEEIRGFYGSAEVPLQFRLIAHDAGYLEDFWGAVRRAFSDNKLTRRFKEALAFAVSLTTRSQLGTAFHLGEMRRLGVTEAGVREILEMTQMFSSFTKIADTLALDADMADMAPVDWSPPPGGTAREAGS
jgi:alkylhydroperoxidase/carboxymuconolactone decarboxylase family protein YurZ